MLSILTFHAGIRSNWQGHGTRDYVSEIALKLQARSERTGPTSGPILTLARRLDRDRVLDLFHARNRGSDLRGTFPLRITDREAGQLHYTF
jgi:hypothetical protein